MYQENGPQYNVENNSSRNDLDDRGIACLSSAANSDCYLIEVRGLIGQSDVYLGKPIEARHFHHRFYGQRECVALKILALRRHNRRVVSGKQIDVCHEQQ